MAECRDLLKEYRANRDVYNITAPFLIENELVIAGRVESRDSEDSEVYFFVEKDGKWFAPETT